MSDPLANLSRKEKLALGIRLSKEGAFHLAFVNSLKGFQDWGDATKDEALAAIFDALAHHKTECGGCTETIVDQVQRKLGR